MVTLLAPPSQGQSSSRTVTTHMVGDGLMSYTIDLIDYVYRIGNIAVLTDRPCNCVGVSGPGSC